MAARLPRQHRGLTPSARVHNIAAAELDACSRSITVRRTRTLRTVEGNGQVYMPANTDLMIPWESVSGGVNKGNWSAGLSPVVNISEAGLYLMLLQVRFPWSGTSVDTSGRRWARIMRNGTSPLSDTIGTGSRVPGNRPTGTTVQALSCRALQVGDTLWCGLRSSHNGAVSGADALGGDYGGTYFTVARMGPGAGALVPDLGGEGSVPRLESRSKPPPEALNLFAQAIDNLGVGCKPRRTSPLALAANVGTTLAWQVDGRDTRGDMWDPAEPTKVVIRISGQYLLKLQIRFPASDGASGSRWCALHLNTTSAGSTIARDDQNGDATFEGTTCATYALVKLAAGDVIYAVAGSTVALSAAAAQDAGGTYLFAARVGRSGSGGSVLEGTGFDPGPVPEAAPIVRGDVIAA